MNNIKFTKMVAAGNDFIVFNDNLKLSTARMRSLARKICDRKYGVGADGLLLLSKSKIADIRMRIFNVDGSEAEMCGNGARCAALYAAGRKKRIKLETIAGIIESEINNNNVRIKLTNPKDIKLDLSLTLNKRVIKVNYIDTGVPHAVVLVEKTDLIDVKSIGESLRFNKKFAPRGTNVDFVQIINKNNIAVRTYERGVEDETLACGTGSAASAIIAGIKLYPIGYRFDYRPASSKKIKVHTKSGAILTVYFKILYGTIEDVWLAGQAEIVYSGRVGSFLGNKQKA